ncbi:MAG: UDP-N-acetylglucosamine 2-epimerase (hydrolyzing) [Candidatus Scalindua sp.]|jgi:UDP-hydrolysing UDP-N-acetyl-D-glucosamine 2-epimerase|nr:UDP-N-acetylglucosamine 2-epimerase (hydrolyzing) [Candidatus Scalindua sp.]
MEKLLVPIVNRTNYTKLRPVILKLQDCNDIDVKVVLSSGIVPRKLTDAAESVYQDNIDVLCELDCMFFNDTLESMVKSLGVSLIEHATVLSRENPTGLLIIGDRYDMLGPVLSAKIMNLPMFHIQGGETSGTIDDTVRDLITRCSTRHYTSTFKSYERVKHIVGNDGVFYTGCPAVESLVDMEIPKRLHVEKFHKHFKDSFDLEPGEPYFIVVAHPDTTNAKDIDMGCLLDAVISFGYKCIVLHPNIDAHREQISKDIRRHKDKIVCISHAPIEDFVQLMANSSCMIGNSSAGIREAASFKVPVVNVGERQRGRERNSNTFDTKCEYNDIRQAITDALSSELSADNIYHKKGSIDFISKDITEYLLGK